MPAIIGFDRISSFLYGEQQLGSAYPKSDRITWFGVEDGKEKRIKILSSSEEISMVNVHFIKGIGFVICHKEENGEGKCSMCEMEGKPTMRFLITVYDYEDYQVKGFLMNQFLFNDFQKFLKHTAIFENDFVVGRAGSGMNTRYYIEYMKKSIFNDLDRKKIFESGYLKNNDIIEKISKGKTEMNEFYFSKMHLDEVGEEQEEKKISFSGKKSNVQFVD